MKILTWNINGIRAIKVPLAELFQKLDSDIICIQETKVTREMLDEASAIVEGYSSYYSFCKTKSGYSGVATFVKSNSTPFKAEEGLTGLLGHELSQHKIGHHGDYSCFTDEELHALDNEGRTMITQHKIMTDTGEEEAVAIINVYCPMAIMDDPDMEERKIFKLKFYRLLQSRAEAILRSGSHVIILGDINASHRPIDHCDPCDEKEFRKHPSRLWLDGLLLDSAAQSDRSKSSSPKFLDSFRYFHPDQKDAFTCWSTVTGARATNYGTRIDYILGDVDLVRKGFEDCIIMPDVEGSDHCPVRASLKWECLPHKKCPPICTKYLPEFAGVQQKLSLYFSKGFEKETNSLTKSDSSDSLPSSQESSKSSDGKVSSSKRSRDTTCSKVPLKKSKSDKKQGSLLSFMVCKTKPSDPTEKAKSSVDPREEPLEVVKSACVENKTEPKAVSSWKNILKGPPTAPLCSGHKEPCLLRTVKKDSLNKGRQFWVCNRPEGHKSNKEARCQHFQWVDSKKP